jgi:hypothetical protein
VVEDDLDGYGETSSALKQGGLTVSTSAPDVTVFSGIASTTVTVSGAGKHDAVSFALTGLPQGVSISFAPPSLTGNGTTTLTIGASALAPGHYVASVEATTAKAMSSAPLDVWVPQPSVLDVGGQLFTAFGVQNAVNGWSTGVLVDCLEAQFAYCASDVSGRIAVIRRGLVSFDDKIHNVQIQGAIGAIIYNNVPGPFIASISTLEWIPAVTVSDDVGATLINQLGTLTTIHAVQPF